MEGNCTTGDVRLADVIEDNSTMQGRVEICVNNAWGTVCDDDFFTAIDAGVICRQMGGNFMRESAVIVAGSEGFGPIFLQELNCEDSDDELLQCGGFSHVGLHSCEHSQDVSVKCFGKIHYV